MSRTFRHAHADAVREQRRPIRRQGTRAQVLDAVLAEYGARRPQEVAR